MIAGELAGQIQVLVDIACGIMDDFEEEGGTG